MRSKARSILVLVCYSLCNLYKLLNVCLPSISKTLIKDDLVLSDFQTGFIFTVYSVFNMIACPISGNVADKLFSYRKFIAVGAIISISVSAMTTSFCKTFGAILLPRILCGLGVGTFTTLGTPILADYFPPEKRSIVLATYSGISSFGSAIGFSLGGALNQRLGWRRTFLTLSIPGFFSVVLLLFKNPKRRLLQPKKVGEGGNEEEVIDPFTAPDLDATYNSYKSYTSYSVYSETVPSPPVGSAVDGEEIQIDPLSDDSTTSNSSSNDSGSSSDNAANEKTPIATNTGAGRVTGDVDYAEPKNYGFCESLWAIFTGLPLVCIVGYTFITFATGAMTDWTSTFYIRMFGFSVEEAGYFNGASCMFGVVGTFLGSFMAELFKKCTRHNPYLLWSGIGLFISSACVSVAFYGNGGKAAVAVIFFALTTIFNYSYIGPVNALFLNCFPPEIRTRANGYQFFVRRALGDAISASIVGMISDANNGRLTAGLFVVPCAFFSGSYVWIIYAIFFS